VTEIPEHLLARSRARREAAGLATPSDAAAPAPTAGGEVEVVSSASPAPAAGRTIAPATAPAPPPPPKPDPPYVRAYKERKRIPWWASPVLALLPIWAFIYTNTLEEPSKTASGPLAAGQTIYGQCASCHGASGGGGVGPALAGGDLAQVFPDYKDQIKWVSLGSNGWPSATYGAINKPKKGGMPSWAADAGGSLTPLQIAEVVRYEREVLAGMPPEPELVAITEGTAPPLDKNGNPVAG
jgi:mono/diheme cytochrome c family protein